MDITQLILDDHHEQRRLFAIVDELDRDESDALSAVWKRLSALLDLHAEAEERLFYPALLELGRDDDDDSAVEETQDAIGDHNEIRDAVAAVEQHRVGSEAWFEAVTKANEVNGDHMAEEEREGLTAFRRHATLARRHELAVAFIGFEADHPLGVEPKDKDPKQYVEEHGGTG